MKTMLLAIVILLAATLVLGQAVPERMNYQGVLTDGGGTPVADGQYDITFSIYTSLSGGAPLWTETNTVWVTGGIFGLMIGTVTPIDLPFDRDYYLGISVDGGTELSPRRQLATTPYSFNSKHVRGIDNTLGGDGYVGLGTLTPAAPLELHFNNFDSNNPAFIVRNNTGSGSSTIDFIHSGTSRGRLRSVHGGALYLTQMANNHVAIQTNGTNRLVAAADGNVMIGASTAPAEKLDVDGAIRLGTTGGTNAGTIRWSGSDFEGYDGAAWQSLTSGGGSGLPAGTLHQALRHNGSDWEATSAVNLTVDADGGGVTTYDEGANWTTRSDADGSGTGGMFYVRRNETNNGFYVEGNWSGTEEPGVGITGSSRSALFRMDLTDNLSVQLPTNSIAAGEVLDEPGVASVASNAAFVFAGGVENVVSRSITAPVAGYVLVVATAQLSADHADGVVSQLMIGVSDAAGVFPTNQDVLLEISSNWPTGYFYQASTVHGLFEVTAGAHTFYLVGREYSGAWTANDVQFSLMFFPTMYGTVEPTLVAGDAPDDASAPQRGALTASEIASERAQSEADNSARIERELSEMRERLERLEAELAAERAGR